MGFYFWELILGQNYLKGLKSALGLDYMFLRKLH